MEGAAGARGNCICGSRQHDAKSRLTVMGPEHKRADSVRHEGLIIWSIVIAATSL